jgi:hypothetical protein
MCEGNLVGAEAPGVFVCKSKKLDKMGACRPKETQSKAGSTVSPSYPLLRLLSQPKHNTTKNPVLKEWEKTKNKTKEGEVAVG